MKIDDKVICINDLQQVGAGPGGLHGKIYTVRGSRQSAGGVYLEEIKLEMQGNEECAFFRWRFHVIDKNWADKVLSEITEQAEVIEFVET